MKASLRCWFCDVTAFTKSFDSPSLSQPVLRRESSGPSGSRVARTGRESRSTRERESCMLARCFKQSDLDTAHRRLVESECLYGAPPMSMVSDDFGLRYLIFHSFRERYTQAFISVVTYVMMSKFNGYQHHL